VAPSRRLIASLLAGALLLAALVAAARGSGASAVLPVQPLSARSIDAQPGTALRSDRIARTAIEWRGGAITASTGEVVNVFVSDALPVESTPESWAEFIAKLTHGPELSRLTAYIVALDEVQDLCGARALGCYSRDQMVAPGEGAAIDASTSEEVVRHEYGHHVAEHRLNAPWRAIDWGPKHWASAAAVCPRVSRREAFPGDEGQNYSQNPGEAWAEVYRLTDERKLGITTATWPIIAPAFFPDEVALQAAERDVLQPWTAGRVVAFRRTFAKKSPKVWWIPLSTPLDGDLRITAALPGAGLHEVALVGGDRSTVIRRAQWVGQRSKQITTTVCGQRSLFVRVTQSGGLGRVRVSASTP